MRAGLEPEGAGGDHPWPAVQRGPTSMRRTDQRPDRHRPKVDERASALEQCQAGAPGRNPDRAGVAAGKNSILVLRWESLQHLAAITVAEPIFYMMHLMSMSFYWAIPTATRADP